jgi:hypothetical protein
MIQQVLQPKPSPEMFLLFYIKRRNEDVSGFQWSEAPFENNPPPEWLTLENAARLFEEGAHKDMQNCMIQRLVSTGTLNFQSFKKTLRGYVDIMMAGNEMPVLPILINTDILMGLITFTGLYVRRLAEQCALQKPYDRNSRTIRHDVSQVSIYGTYFLLSFLPPPRYWKKMCAELSMLMKM